MEKALIFSDLHLHVYKQFNQNNQRLKNGIDFLDYIFKLANKNNIRYIIFGGDLFNLMQIIATKVINATTLCFQNNFSLYPDINFIAITGNHDYSDKNLINSPGESALRYLAELFPDNFRLLDDQDKNLFITEKGHVIYGLSYFEYPEHFRQALLELQSNINPLEKGYNTFLLMHQVVASGLPIEDHIQPNDSLFDKFDFIFNGHIHNCEQITDKFINIGSSLSRDAGDIGKKKGFWIVDLDDPLATISFKDITDRYPQFIHKTVGEPLTEWESKQFVIWVPLETVESSSDNSRNEKFRNTLSPAIIMENYCKEVLSANEVKEKLTYGVSLL